MNKLDQKVVMQLLHSKHGVRSGEFATTLREAVDIFEKSILPPIVTGKLL